MPEYQPDLCHGYKEIGAHLGLASRQVKHLHQTRRAIGFPSFKIGRNVCALRSKLDLWLRHRQEQEANANG